MVPSVQGRHLVKAVDVSRTLSISYLAHTEPLTTNPVQLQLYDNAMETLNLESEILHKKFVLVCQKLGVWGQTLSEVPPELFCTSSGHAIQKED